jgi:hypothetical protein
MTKSTDSLRTDVGTDGPPPTPRWVKAFVVVFGIMIVVVVVLHATGHGMHGH